MQQYKNFTYGSLVGGTEPTFLATLCIEMPGYSDFEEDIRSLGEHLGQYKSIQRVEILPYHRLGVHKYEAMGWDYQLKEVKENTPEQLERAEKLFKEYFETVIVN